VEAAKEVEVNEAVNVMEAVEDNKFDKV